MQGMDKIYRRTREFPPPSAGQFFLFLTYLPVVLPRREKIFPFFPEHNALAPGVTPVMG